VERYLRTGQTDLWYGAWTGDIMERAGRAHDDLRGALVREVQRLTEGRTHPPLPHSDTVALTRAKVAPMVRGLFPRSEQDVVLATLEKSVVFVTSDNIEELLLAPGFDHTACGSRGPGGGGRHPRRGGRGTERLEGDPGALCASSSAARCPCAAQELMARTGSRR
jgi:hypothetical protein